MSTGVRDGVLDLAAAGQASSEVVGGKARGLGRLIESGFRVPWGFVVPATLDMPEDVERMVEASDTARFAVRSSAVGEDSESASWAGQFSTELDVRPERVWEAVERCRSSLGSKRADGYAEDRHVRRPLSMAVVVQKMVDAVTAGTIFTQGLARGDSLVIEAVSGRGESLVSGAVTPEKVVVERDGTVNSIDSGGLSDGRLLDDIEIAMLVELGLAVESAFGRPMDVEWAIDGDGELLVLQARPITATSSIAGRPYSLWSEDDLFRWGPTAGRYFYISDYVVAACGIASVARGASLPWTVLTFDDSHQMVWLTTASGWYGLAEHCFREVCLDAEATAALRRRYDTACERLEGFFEVRWAALDREELLASAKRFYKAVNEFWLSTLPAELGNYRGEAVLDESLRDHVPHRDVRAAVARMLFETEGLSAEQRKRVELAEATDVEAHWRAHRFDLSSYLGPRERSLEDFEEEKRAIDGTAIGELWSHANEADEARSRAIENLALPDGPRRIGSCLASTLAWQEDRKRVANRSMAVKMQILRQAAKVLGRDESSLHCLGYYELLAALQGDAEPLSAAGERPAILFSTEIERLPANEARTLWLSYAHPPIQDPDARSIEGGRVAFVAPAPITGTARVVTEAGADPEFDDGDVLIAPRTAPEFELLMRRAGAVVTDSGGQTSHTAVFCRENSLPGVVGLDNATRLIGDGQRITVRTSGTDGPGMIDLHAQHA